MAEFCSSCGGQVSSADTFCCACGASVGGSSPAPPPPSGPHPGVSPAWYQTAPGIVGIMLGVAAAAAVAVIVVMSGGDDTDPVAGSSIAPSSTSVTTTSMATTSSTTTTSTTTTTTLAPGAYSEETLAVFMDDCGGFLEESECVCIIDEIEGFISDEELALALGPDEMSPVAEAALTAALDLCTTTPEIPGEPFADEIRTEFLNGCTPESGEDFCVCVLEELEATLTEEEFLQLRGADDPESADALVGAAVACIDLAVDPGSDDPLITPVALPYSCTNDFWVFTVNFPADWMVYVPGNDEFACQYYSQTGFDGLTESQVSDAAVEVSVAGVWEYDDLIAGIRDLQLSSEEQVSVAGRSGWVFQLEDEDSSGSPAHFYLYVLPLWPDVPGSPPIVIEAQAAELGSDLWDAAVAAVDAMAAAIEISPYSP